ncbi:MAG: 16S rRNA (guanine(966)-N(2))-methyltransferase RsmD [Pseudomonadota bacterium]|nr:16S rRNA (guanine(966)-N(2))-methyltransferase RsmD [Pseudomonadota bacterium]
MRIIAGEWRGRTIAAPAGDATRPTADRTRETLFSMLVSRIGSFEGLRVADLFAGSGALGFEALSRGAAHVTFVENDMDAVKAIQANLVKLGAGDRAEVRLTSALKLPSSAAFDLILADPPYSPKAGIATLASVLRANWLCPGGWLAIETMRKQLVAAPEGLTIDAERDTGPARITLLRS